MAEFGIAVNRTWNGPDGDRREETCFVDIVVWSRRAEICHANLSKASPVFVEGRLHLDTWSSAGGEKRSRLKVVANNVVFLNPPPRIAGGGGRAGQDRQGEPRQHQAAPVAAPSPEASPTPEAAPSPEASPTPEKALAPGGEEAPGETAGASSESGTPKPAETPEPPADLPEPGGASDFPF